MTLTAGFDTALTPAALGPLPHMPLVDPPAGAWTRICRFDDLIPGRGVAALLDTDGTQAAIFRIGPGDLYAVGNRDPFTGDCVISRGLTGARDSVPTVASPMLKHIFDLRTGQCIDGPAGPEPVALPVYPVRCADGFVSVFTCANTIGTGEPQ